ncbi:hypothetical protein G5V57_11305 [Nordella sp. HKS 07]|nr:hypothetical protein [Nordella sp. HKS 07]QIG48261.1 hypothetical protein G5V57_11305 [Nordella sp. HKS 07]
MFDILLVTRKPSWFSRRQYYYSISGSRALEGPRLGGIAASRARKCLELR